MFCQTLYRDDGKSLGVIARYYEEGATYGRREAAWAQTDHHVVALPGWRIIRTPPAMGRRRL